MRGPVKTNFANVKSKSRKKKAEKKPEIVTCCDQCKIPLKRTCCRTTNSAICAEGVGIITKKYFGGGIKFFCSEICVNNS